MSGARGGGEVELSTLRLFSGNIRTVEQALTVNEDDETAFIEIGSIYSIMNINESILTPFQTGQITLNDSNDTIPDFPIAGGNILHVVYNIKDGPPETEIDCWYRIVNVKNVVINERKQAYTMQFISEDGWKNMHTVLVEAFEGSPSDIITEIFQEYLFATPNKRLITDESVGSLKFVCPHWRPAQAIKWVTGKSLSSLTDTPGFFFYESMKGFRFMSTDTLFDREKNVVITDLIAEANSAAAGEGLKRGYMYKIPGVAATDNTGQPNTALNETASIQNVDDFRVMQRQPYGKDLLNGNIQLKHITHDLFTKEVIVNTWNYHDNFSDTTRLGAIPHYEKPLEPYDENIKIILSPKNSKLHTNGGDGSRAIYADDYAMYRHVIMKQINDEVIDNFETPGNPVVEVGRLLEFNYPAIRKIVDPVDEYQVKYSGLYLIRDVIHTFRPVVNETTSYKVDMNIVKDGWNE